MANRRISWRANSKDAPYTPGDAILSNGHLTTQSPSSSTLAISPMAPSLPSSGGFLDPVITTSNTGHTSNAFDTPRVGKTPVAGLSTSASVASSRPQLSQVDRLRLWRHDAIMQHHYNSAEYIGDKILALTNDPNDAFWLAQVYYLSEQYTRARQILLRQELDRSVSCRYLAALCLTKMGKWDEALTILGERNPFQGSVASKVKNQDGGIKLEASMCYLRGQIYTNQNNFDRAKECYKEAVQVDAKCFEAFDQLIRSNLLTPKEEWEFIKSLDFVESADDNAELVKALYTTRLGKFENVEVYKEADALLRTTYGLQENGDILLSQADLLFVQCKFKQCLELCERILEQDKFKFSVMPNYLSCLHELGRRNKLFLIAHELADNHPDEPVSWLAVGIYYLTIGKVPEARRFFSKSSMMNPYFGHAWIGFAHTFAVEGEHEQAISAYSTAARLFQGTHLPSLFLGMQHLQLNNLTLAEEYLQTAYTICTTDPLLLNEMGVVFYHKNELALAEEVFMRAQRAAETLDSDPRGWLSIKANLGHVHRRLGHYETALGYFEEVLRITPQDANIYSAMGLVQLQAGYVVPAVQNFHEALGIAPNDPVASDLLKRALEETVNRDFEDILEDDGVFDSELEHAKELLGDIISFPDTEPEMHHDQSSEEGSQMEMSD